MLHVSRDADASTIKRAYRKLALKLHPDKVEGSDADKESAAKRFAEISHAYEVLSDSEKRQLYDRYGEEGFKGAAGGGSGGGFPNDVFNQFFGGGGFGGFGGFGGRGGGPEEEETPKGATVTVEIRVPLSEMYTGSTVDLVRDKGHYVPAPGKRKCRCKNRVVTRQLGPGMFQQYTDQVCEECENVALEREKEHMTLHVPAGAPEDYTHTFFEEGEPIVDGEPGDLIVRVRSLPHPVFERRGDGLLANVTISLLDALVGFRKELEHLDGHKVEIGTDRVTTPGQIRWFEGQGMPKHNANKGEKGDLWITFDIQFPESMSDAQKQLARDMLGGNQADTIAKTKDEL